MKPTFPLSGFLFILALASLAACDPPELRKARQAVVAQDFATALALYEKLCAEHPKELLWREEYSAAVRDFKAKVMVDKRNGPDERFSHEEVELLVSELLRRKDLEGAAAVLFDRARLNLANRHWLHSASYLLRAAAVVPHQDQRVLYERQAIEVLATKASPAEALPVATAKVAEFPTSVRWCDLKATLLATEEDYDAAIAEYTRCQEIDPDNFDNQVRFGAQIAAMQEYKRRAGKPK